MLRFIFSLLVFLLITIAGTAATFLYYSQPTGLQSPRTITIPKGISARAIGIVLELGAGPDAALWAGGH